VAKRTGSFFGADRKSWDVSLCQASNGPAAATSMLPMVGSCLRSAAGAFRTVSLSSSNEYMVRRVDICRVGEDGHTVY
jgi:hypothetical protein